MLKQNLFFSLDLTSEDRDKADNILNQNLKGRRSPVRKRLGKLSKKKDPLCTRMRIQEINTGGNRLVSVEMITAGWTSRRAAK